MTTATPATRNLDVRYATQLERNFVAQEARDFVPFRDLVQKDRKPAPDYVMEKHPVTFDDYSVDTSEFTSVEFQRLEVEKLWSRVWQMACRENEIRNVGDYIEYEIADFSIIIVRDTPETIKAFRNACRHRGTAVATGTGNVSCFNCPFHGWIYGLDGKLEVLPAAFDFPHVDKSKFGLLPVAVDTFDGYVWINLDVDAAPLEEFLGETVMRHMGRIPDNRMRKAWHFVRIVEANWKIMMVAFFEAYHAFRTHPQQNAYVGDLQSEYDAWGPHSRTLAPTGVMSPLAVGRYSEQEILDDTLTLSSARFSDTVREYEPVALKEDQTAREVIVDMVRARWSKQGVDLSDYSDTEVIDGILYNIFPNAIFFGAAGHVVYRFRPNGDDPNSCIFEVSQMLPIPEGEEMPMDSKLIVIPRNMLFREFEPSRELVGEIGYTQDQDVSNAPLIQKGVYNLDKLVFAQRQEANIVNFHRHLESWLERK